VDHSAGPGDPADRGSRHDANFGSINVVDVSLALGFTSTKVI
jgi:hypothetical protein